MKFCIHAGYHLLFWDMEFSWLLLFIVPSFFQQVVDCGALEALVICLEEFDPGVKESAAWALGYIARHNTGWCVSLIIILSNHYNQVLYTHTCTCIPRFK